jgi:hypothetical protein
MVEQDRAEELPAGMGRRIAGRGIERRITQLTGPAVFAQALDVESIAWRPFDTPVLGLEDQLDFPAAV